MQFHFYADCLPDLDKWMALNKLKLPLFTAQPSTVFTSIPLRFGSDIIQPSSSSRNVGVVFDSTMSMLPQVKSVCKSAFYHLRNISRKRKLLSTKTTETLVHAVAVVAVAFDK